MSLSVLIALGAAALVAIVLLVALALGHRHRELVRAHAPEDEEPDRMTIARKIIAGFTLLVTLFGAGVSASPALSDPLAQPPAMTMTMQTEQRRELFAADALACALGGDLDPAMGLPDVDEADRPRCEALLRRLDGYVREQRRLAVEDADAERAAERARELAEAVRSGEIDGRWALPWLASADDLPQALDDLYEVHTLMQLGERAEAARSLAEFAERIEKLLHERAKHRRGQRPANARK